MNGVTVLVRIILATVFFWSAVSKARSLGVFADHVGMTLPLPRTLSRAVAVGTIAAEVLVVLSLLLLISSRLGFSLSLVLLAAFTGYLVRLRLWSRGTPCGCVGGATNETSWLHVIRNVTLAILAATALLLVPDSERESVTDYALLLVPGVTVGLFLLYLDDIFSFFRK